MFSLIPREQKGPQVTFKMENGKWKMENEKTRRSLGLSFQPRANRAVIAKKVNGIRRDSCALCDAVSAAQNYLDTYTKNCISK
jgi:hypothetical protein